MNKLINEAFLRLTRRAESRDRAKLVETFVDAAPLITLLSTRDHQVIYGRRGTGKTHALLFLQDLQKRAGHIAIYLDMRTVGSTGGLYSDSSISIPERGTRLLSDALAAIHDGLLEHILEHDDLDLAALSKPLDSLAESITQVSVIGEVEQEKMVGSTSGTTTTSNQAISISARGVDLAIRNGAASEATSSEETRSIERGVARNRVHFGGVSQAFNEILQRLGPRRVWILLDEWSVIPTELQPYLADLLRRSLLPHAGITLKIGAIEQRTRLHMPGLRGDYIGIEVGADVTADLNLDDFMVFDNDSRRATNFFQDNVVQTLPLRRRSRPLFGPRKLGRTYGHGFYTAQRLRRIHSCVGGCTTGRHKHLGAGSPKGIE